MTRGKCRICGASSLSPRFRPIFQIESELPARVGISLAPYRGTARTPDSFGITAETRGGTIWPSSWLCDEHFEQTLYVAAELEAADRRKLDAEWEAHFEKYLRENNLNLAELTENQTRQIHDEAHRWLQEKRVEKGQNKHRD